MSELFHTRARAVARTAGACAARHGGRAHRAGARRLRRARVFFGHGTDNARDEAAALVLHALGLPHAQAAAPATAGGSSGRRAARRAALLAAAHQGAHPGRLPHRRQLVLPGLPFRVDARVLVPRSPLAELIERGFAPWTRAGTRCGACSISAPAPGCIAIAARAGAAACAGGCGGHLGRGAGSGAHQRAAAPPAAARARCCRSDHFRALAARTYDIIVTQSALRGGARAARAAGRSTGTSRAWRSPPGAPGLIRCAIILREAARHLRPRGLLVVEVGNTERAVRRALSAAALRVARIRRAAAAGCSCSTREQLQAALNTHVRQHHRQALYGHDLRREPRAGARAASSMAARRGWS